MSADGSAEPTGARVVTDDTPDARHHMHDSLLAINDLDRLGDLSVDQRIAVESTRAMVAAQLAQTEALVQIEQRLASIDDRLGRPRGTFDANAI